MAILLVSRFCFCRPTVAQIVRARGAWVPDLRSPQVGFTRLAHIKVPISGKPEIGALARPEHEILVSRASGAKRNETRDPGACNADSSWRVWPRSTASAGHIPIAISAHRRT